jgi:molybdate transport system substrate-binding protein
MTHHRPIARRAAILLALLCVAGCGGGGAASHKPQLTVSAAASLKAAFTAYARHFSPATVRYSFAGSDALAAQIEQGARPDVFAAANQKLPALLYSRGLVSRPMAFAANRLVIAVPAGSAKVSTLDDLEKPGVMIAIGSESVPIGAYTRTVLGHLGARAKAILAHVRTEEPDVSGIVGKLTEGAVDAGFTYITDVRATHGALRAIPLPASLQPVVSYGVAVVRGSAHQAQARTFVAGLLRGAGRRALLAAGFLPPGR